MDGYEYDDNRRRWLLIGAAAVAALVLLAVAFGIGRASAPGPGPAQRATTATTQAGPGPTRVVNGVPVGYAHTEAGAVAAATNFLMVVDGPLVTQPDRYRSAIGTLAAPEAREKQRSDAEKRMDGLQNLTTSAQQGRTVIDRVSPLAYHVERYSDSGARVAIWAESFIAVDGVLAMRETWTTSRIGVEWVNGDWRLSDVGAAVADSFGPVPLTVQPAGVSASVPPQLVQYRSYQPYVG